LYRSHPAEPHVSSVEVKVLERTRSQVRRFVRFAERVYRDNPLWVAPIYLQQELQIRKGPFHEIGDCRLLMAFRDGQPVARLSVHRNFDHDAYYHIRQGFFGFFEALEDDEAVAALFAAGEAWLRERGCTAVLGPVSFAIYDEVALLVDGFDDAPVVLCPYNPPYYRRLLEANGYGKEVDWFAFEFNSENGIPERWERIAGRILKRPGVSMRHPNLKDWDNELDQVRAIFNDAWGDNWGHVPMTEAQWKELAGGLRLIVRPELCWIVSLHGEPVAFSVTLPDLNEAIGPMHGHLLPLGWAKLLLGRRHVRSLRTLAMGVLKPHRGHGYEVAMITETIRTGWELEYAVCDCSLVVETNTPMLGVLEALGVKPYKTFRVYRKALAPSAAQAAAAS
jgi:GNAT superfamily N-acetyltransferase